MSSHEGRHSFLLGMTLNELAFLMFFLLMLLSTTALHQKAEQLEQEALKNKNLELEIAQTKKDLDASFKRLQRLENAITRIAGLGSSPTRAQLDQAFEKLQAIENINQLVTEIDRLKKEQQRTEPLQIELKRIDPSAPPVQTLKTLIEKNRMAQSEQQNLRGQFHFLRRQLKSNGLDHPPCWADPKTGNIQYLYRITIYEHTIKIEPVWPDSRSQDLKSIPGARALAGQTLGLEAFKSQVESVYHWSKARDCRHFVRIHDDPMTTKHAFKKALLTIESVFYKYLEH